MTYILAIESSCDESSISLIKDDVIMDNITFSQEKYFKKIGGVIPEQAARMHEQNLPLVLDKLIKKHNLDILKLDAVAVTTSPGLIGCLQMGLQMAKTISALINKPLIEVDHLMGHVYSGEINHKYTYPLLALVVSGGNTQLVYVQKEMDYQIIGKTLDDAVGESFDKVARKLGLGYPGGPIIDKLSKKGKVSIGFPIANLDGYNFSYSGLKSSVINYLNSSKMKKEILIKEDVAASFQHSAISQLIIKLQKAISNYKCKKLVVVGGVAANSLLRKKVLLIDKNAIFPKMEYCTDNAAMIAKVAIKKYKLKNFTTLNCKASPS